MGGSGSVSVMSDSFSVNAVLKHDKISFPASQQVQSLASFCSTFLGTAVRIPCEVLKQRCQAGLFDNVGEALVGTWNQDGLKGFFRGTGATLCREVPFYVAGMGLYAESKKVQYFHKQPSFLATKCILLSYSKIRVV